MERQCIIVPFDDSQAAQATLRRAAQAARQGQTLYDRVLVATTGDQCGLVGVAMAEARALAGPAISVEAYLLDPGDPLGSLHRLIAVRPDATLAAPVGLAGRAPWYSKAARLGGMSHTMMLFFLRPADLLPANAPSPTHNRWIPRLSALIRRIRSTTEVQMPGTGHGISTSDWREV